VGAHGERVVDMSGNWEGCHFVYSYFGVEGGCP
jgi:hypothetical protein